MYENPRDNAAGTPPEPQRPQRVRDIRATPCAARGKKQLSRLRNTIADHSGSVAITFALALIPMIAMVGAAVDYSHAALIRTAMQSAADATALAVSKNAATSTSTQMQSAADSYYRGLFTRADLQNLAVTTTYSTTSGSSLALNAAGTMTTTFMGMVGVKTIALNVTGTAAWGNSFLRVALVLDNTGSMANDGKITALKTATNNLLSQLKNAATNNGDVYVSIIPFSKDVSVDPTSNYAGAWIDWTEWAAPPSNSTPSSSVGPGSSCPYSDNSNGFHCVSGPSNGSSNASSIPSSGGYAGYICPSQDNGRINPTQSGTYYNGCYTSVATTTTTTTTVGTGGGANCNGYSNCSCTGSGKNKVCTQTTTTVGAPYTHTWIANNQTTWTGCITDRGTSSAPSPSNYDQNVVAPSGAITATLYPTDQYQYCTLPMMGLSYDWTAMTSLVGQMTPNGSTNQPIGLVWGWLSLVGGGPLTAPAMASNNQYQQVIILLSDGLNTQDRWYGDGSNVATQVDTRMTGTCANIKAAGITIYSVQVNTAGDPTSTLMKNCATDASKFFLLTSATEIITTFNQIGTNLSQLRIAK